MGNYYIILILQDTIRHIDAFVRNAVAVLRIYLCLTFECLDNAFEKFFDVPS